MPLIFVSYRKNDSVDIAGRITADLTRIFGPQQVFQDAINIQAGDNWQAVLNSALQQSVVMLVLIGPHWNPEVDTHGVRRLDDPEDWVRFEVERGLKQPQTIVVPVYVQGARMLAEKDLPESLRPLLERQAIQIRSNPHYDHDFALLVRALEKRVPRAVNPPVISVGENLALLRDQDERLKEFRGRVSVDLRRLSQQAEVEQETLRDVGLQRGTVRSLVMLVVGLIAGAGAAFVIAQAGNVPVGIGAGVAVFVLCVLLGRAAPPAGPTFEITPTPQIFALRSALARTDEQIERNRAERERLHMANRPPQNTGR